MSLERPHSLARRVAVFTSLGFGVVVSLSILVMASVLQSETSEQRDEALREMSPIAMALLTRAVPLGGTAGVDIAQHGLGDLDDHETSLVFALVDPHAGILLKSHGNAAFPDPQRVGTERFYADATHRFYISAPNARGEVVILAEANAERKEAVLESLLAFSGPMIPLIAIAFLMVRWVARGALRPLIEVSNEISARGHGLLEPIERAGLPSELRAVVITVNGFMGRLSKALDAERHFASNAAHELRTPLAVALAKTQHLKSRHRNGDVGEIEAVEQALKHMTRLVERLLQLGRADAGSRASNIPTDLGDVLALLVHERSGVDPLVAARLEVCVEDAPVISRISADDFAIIASNLIDNAVRYGDETQPVVITLGMHALSVSNRGPVIAADDLSMLTTRFARHDARGGGLGLGLYISDTLARNIGGALTLSSPAIGAHDGVSAVFTFPKP
ncbi:sensor histidine kinase [Celeribacter marinus]|uniref:sensor histidine kinase n=1 Tax=Celeribacter marinus TaxID=1397108 RepID=UPI003F6D402D